MVFSTDSIPSIASFLGVSLHLLLELEVPLYCKTQEGDCLFDYYTLLTETERKTFLELIRIHVEHTLAKFRQYSDRLKGR